jgi:methylthioribose-1-phosphate isomerase
VRIRGIPHRSVWLEHPGGPVCVIDQTLLPHRVEVRRLRQLDDVLRAILEMQVRGAPLIGVVAAFGMVLAAREDPSTPGLETAAQQLRSTRPTAVNLEWAVSGLLHSALDWAPDERAFRLETEAQRMADADVESNRAIGRHGLELLRTLSLQRGGAPVRVLTHCNAGWLATVDWGTATAPLYLAHQEGVPVHVWVSETRPRNQGAALTTWELGEEGISHTLLADNAAGYLLQQGWVDLCFVGADRITRQGDVANKIGTYLKALAAADAGVPFYVAAPTSTLDRRLSAGAEVPIERRSPDEVRWVSGVTREGHVESIRISPPSTPALNPAFDVTPARLITGLITEEGIVPVAQDS